MTVRELFDALDDGNQSQPIMQTESGHILLWVARPRRPLRNRRQHRRYRKDQGEEEAVRSLRGGCGRPDARSASTTCLTLIRVEAARELRRA